MPAVLSLDVGGPASFGAFAPGVTQTYTATVPAVVTATAGDAALDFSDPGHLANGAFTLPQPLQVELSRSAWNGPVTAAPVTITFRQPIAGTDALRTGAYTGTVTFTLSTISP